MESRHEKADEVWNFSPSILFPVLLSALRAFVKDLFFDYMYVLVSGYVHMTEEGSDALELEFQGARKLERWVT